MSPRVGGILALTAAVILAISSFPVGKLVGHRSVSSWWSGGPTIGETTYHRKEVHIGLLTVTGCDVADEETVCRPLDLGSAFKITKYVELALVSLLVLALVLCGASAMRGSNSRKVFARLVLGAAAASAVVSIVLLAMGPNLKTGKSESVPLAAFGGLGLFFLGTALSIVGGVMSAARIRPRAPKILSAPQPAAAAHVPPSRDSQQAVFDVLALLQQEDAVRPAALGPEPMMGRSPASPGGALPGPAGPLAPMTPPPGAAQPLFSSAPQLRPLYDAPSDQGGADGFVRPAQPQLPTRGPTPIPQATVDAFTRPPTPPVSPSPTVMGLPAAPPLVRPGLPPPLRGKPPTMPPPPPIPRPPKPLTKEPPIAKPQATLSAAAVPIPTGLTPPPPAASSLFSKPVLTPGGTLAGVSAALPKVDDDDLDDADSLAGTSSYAKDDPDADPVGTVNYRKVGKDEAEEDGFDAMATAARDHDAATEDTLSATTDVGDSTAANEFDSATGTDNATFESEEDDHKGRAGTVPASPATLTAAARSVMPRKSGPIDSAGPPTATQQAVVPPARTTGKVVISTAPQTLPPPKEKPAQAAGPSPACPQCESPMAWVEEHLRFYCKSCRMYF